jgi:hypothetical protein
MIYYAQLPWYIHSNSSALSTTCHQLRSETLDALERLEDVRKMCKADLIFVEEKRGYVT